VPHWTSSFHAGLRFRRPVIPIIPFTRNYCTADKYTPPKNPHKPDSSDFGENPVEKLGIASISMKIQ